MQPSDVSEGSWVILLLAGGERRLVQVRPGAKLHVGRQHCTLDPLIGTPFGANFRVEPVGLVRYDPTGFTRLEDGPCEANASQLIVKMTKYPFDYQP